MGKFNPPSHSSAFYIIIEALVILRFFIPPAASFRMTELYHPHRNPVILNEAAPTPTVILAAIVPDDCFAYTPSLEISEAKNLIQRKHRSFGHFVPSRMTREPVILSEANDYRDVGGRATQEAKADDYRDVGGRATQEAKADGYRDVGGRKRQERVFENLSRARIDSSC